MAEVAAVRRLPAVTAAAGLRPMPPAARFILRGSADVIRIGGAAIDIDIQHRACRASTAGTSAALWLGPDEYLLLAAAAEGRAVALALEAALQGEPHSLVEVSHRQTGLEVSGPHAADILNSGCPLDLDLAAFPVQMCTRTVFAKAEIVLWRTAVDVFRLEVWRSFTDYLGRYLAQVAREY